MPGGGSAGTLSARSLRILRCHYVLCVHVITLMQPQSYLNHSSLSFNRHHLFNSVIHFIILSHLPGYQPPSILKLIITHKTNYSQNEYLFTVSTQANVIGPILIGNYFSGLQWLNISYLKTNYQTTTFTLVRLTKFTLVRLIK